MSDVQPPPWWHSGGSSDGSSNEDPNGPSQSVPDESWLSLLGSLSSLASQWWTSSQTGEHDQHGDPADYPDCLVCRVRSSLSVVLAEPDVQELPPIRWLPVRRL
jgi:hypothetical protein